MNHSWSLTDLRAYIRQSSGKDELIDIVNSVGRTAEIFNYHVFTARDAMKGIVDESNPVGIKNTLLVFGASDQQDQYAYAKIVNEANVIGCIQTARNIFDIFAQLLNGLLLESILQSHVCDISKVSDKLPDSELKYQLKKLMESFWYAYVVGFVNTTKHRRLVQHQFTVSIEHGVAGIRLGAFKYKERDFPSYWSTEVLEGAIEVKNSIIICGRTLNRICGASSA